MKNLKYLVVIPARFESSRFPGKLLTKIYNKTLIEHTYKNTLKALKPEKVILAVDDQKLFDHAKEIEADVLMTSKECLNGTMRVHEVTGKLPDLNEDSIVINVQGDEPCLEAGAIDKLIKVLEKNPDIKMATLVAPFPHINEAKESSCVKCVFDKDHNALYFSRSLIPHTEDASQIYLHVGVYAFRKSFLDTYAKLETSPLQKAEDLEQLKVLENGYKIKVVIIDHPSMGVDVPSDIKKVEQHLCP